MSDFSEEHVKNDLNRHFSNYFQHFKIRDDEKFLAVGSCSTVTSLCCVFLNLPFIIQKLRVMKLFKLITL